jgi:hypothetical protein
MPERRPSGKNLRIHELRASVSRPRQAIFRVLGAPQGVHADYLRIGVGQEGRSSNSSVTSQCRASSARPRP